MRRHHFAVVILGMLLALASARSSLAALPNPASSFVSPCFVSCPLGDIDFTVIVRDIANVPVASSTVEIDLSTCSGVAFCAAQEPGTTLNPTLKRVARVTDANGVAVFHLHMGGLCPSAQMKVTADGVPLALRNVASMDQDGNLLVDAADQALVAVKVGGTDVSADFDCTKAVDNADLAVFAGHLGHACDASTPALRHSWGRVKILYR